MATKESSPSVFGSIRDNFKPVDYFLFAGMLIISTSIGVYYACRDVHKSYEEFIMGRRRLHCLPVGMSLTASFVSSITMLGTPVEIYRYGSQFCLMAISYALMVVINAHIFLPVYHRVQFTSVYEYLELRYNNKYLRMTGTVLYIFQTIFYSGIVIYTPAQALNQVTGFQSWAAIVGTGIICVLYCILGGLKAIIWTDTIQLLIMVIAMIVMISKTVSLKGGLSCVMEDARQGGRQAVWDFNPNPYQRHSFWSLIVGGTFTWLSVYIVNQTGVQRCLSCRSIVHAKVALYINLLGLWTTLTCAVLSGLSMYSMFKDCDPWSAKLVAAPDQLVPYLALKLSEKSPGFLGFFVAGTYSGTLSTISSNINSLAAVTVEDLFRRNLNLSEEDLSSLCMGMNLLFGIMSIVMAAMSSAIASVLQASLTVLGVIGGPLSGVFSLGILVPFANAKGAFSGLIIGVIFIMWIGFGSLKYTIPPHRAKPLSLSTAGCHYLNWTVPNTTAIATPVKSSNIYEISYLYLSPSGMLLTIAVGAIVSLSTGGYKQHIDPRLLFGKDDLIADYRYLKAKAEEIYKAFHPASQEYPY